jgi:5-hydroxyisourate hydrolase
MAGGRLTTHVLDTMNGKPASGLRIDLLMIHGDHMHHLVSTHTNQDGRVEQPLLQGEHFRQGEYELNFHVGQYFSRLGMEAERTFLDVVPVRFVIGDAEAHYHVPLLVAPYGYTTYRGS